MTRERPILFSGPMVRAILDGRKTQTRRLVKPSLPDWTDEITQGTKGFYCEGSTGLVSDPFRCPYGQPGDRLWVRETWQEMCRADAECYCETRFPSNEYHYIEYKADTGNKRPGDWPNPEEDEFQDAPSWRPSIHMPRWASRINLEITGVRVERVQEITEEDAKDEGASQYDSTAYFLVDRKSMSDYEYRSGFAYLWDSINGEDSWELNPWVWVIEFKRVEA